MVKNIAQHANGAQIKINSVKDSKSSIREVSVAINGTLEGKYRAAHLIIEQVEIFKYGGPVNTPTSFLKCSFPFIINSSLTFFFLLFCLLDNSKWKSLESKLSCTDPELRPI